MLGLGVKVRRLLHGLNQALRAGSLDEVHHREVSKLETLRSRLGGPAPCGRLSSSSILQYRPLTTKSRQRQVGPRYALGQSAFPSV